MPVFYLFSDEFLVFMEWSGDQLYRGISLMALVWKGMCITLFYLGIRAEGSGSVGRVLD